MKATDQPWEKRWQQARRQAGYTNADAFGEALRAAGHGSLSQSTVLAWEGTGRTSRPGREYRPILAAFSPYFAPLIQELERASKQPVLSRADLTARLRGLAETVVNMQGNFETLARRVEALERQRAGGVGGST